MDGWRNFFTRTTDKHTRMLPTMVVTIMTARTAMMTSSVAERGSRKGRAKK